MGGVRSLHTSTRVDTVCAESGRCFTAYIASVMDAEAVRLYGPLYQPSSGFPLLGAGVMATICTLSFCGCSGSPASRRSIVFSKLS